MDILQFGLVAIVIFIILFWSSNRRPKGFPRGPLGLPVVGYLPFLGELPFKTYVQLGKKYGNVFSVRLGNSFVVVLNDWSAIKEAFISQADAFDGRPQNVIFETLFNYSDIASVEGETLKERRSFTIHHLKSLGLGKSSFERVIMEEVTVMLQKLQAHNNQIVKIQNYFYFFDSLFNIIWSLVGEDNIIQIAKDLFLAGTDPTANTLTWALLYVALWPKFQEKVQQEMDDVVGRQRLPAFKDRTQLPYTCSIILEIHRYSTIPPFGLFHAVMRDSKLFGHILPKGTVVAPNLWAVHHDPCIWGDPEVFRPERFLNKDGQVEKPDFLIPFSLGRRICPGKSFADMTMFLFFTCLLHQFTFSLKPGEELPNLDPVYTLALFPRPFSLLVKQRSN